MIQHLKELWAYRDLIYNLVVRDLKVRYKNSLLGILWSWLNPLLMMLIFTFVFGLARQGGKACLVSLARTEPAFYGLPPDQDLRDRRAIAEVLHELGHLAQLEHCPDRGCLMSFAGNVEKVDARGTRFCAACTARLPLWLRGRPPLGDEP